VDRDSAAGYVVPRRHLEREGLDPDRYFSSELFLQSHYAVVDAVASGRVDAGATFCTLDPTTGTVLTAGWTDAEGAVLRPMQPVVRMGPIPNDTVVASRSLVEAERAAVLQWLLQPDVPSQRAAFEALRASSFRAVSPEHYGPLRRLCAR
jgi:phosphonate transport system substrate-binding protein